MAAIFCLRLTCGLVGALLLLSPAQAPPRFFRVQYLCALGLTAVAGFFLRDLAESWFWFVLGSAGIFYLAGSILWQLEGAPGRRPVSYLACLSSMAALIMGASTARGELDPWWLAADDLTSAALLGAATSAMLMGHTYLVAPAMSLAPLFRLLAALGVALGIRLVLAGAGLWLWTERSPQSNLEREMILWLGVRWGLGFLVPFVLGWLAWETARIRSTQSATGILYVVVIVVFLGELTSLLLVAKAGFIL